MTMTRCAEVIKRESIEMDGSVSLKPAAGANTHSQPPTYTPEETKKSVQHAEVIESNAEYAIIEVTCTCGCKSQIECHY